MSKWAVIKSTQVMIAFEVSGDREQDLVSLLQAITQIALLIWACWQKASQLRREAFALLDDCRQATSFTITVMVIGLTACLYGIGVRL